MRTDDYKREQYRIITGPLKSYDLNGKSVLDIGAGNGELAELCRRKGASVLCIENDPHCIRCLRRKGFSVMQIDLEKLETSGPLNKIFDLVIMSDVIEHVYNCDNLVKWAKGNLKYDGRMIVTTPNHLHWKLRIKFLLGDSDFLDYPHEHKVFFTKRTFTLLFGKYFEKLVVKMKGSKLYLEVKE